MDSAVSQTIESYLDHYGWAFRPIKQGQWLTGWQGEQRYFPLGVSVCESWLTLTIKPFVEWHDGWNRTRDIANYLMKLNNYCPMVKFALDEQGDICLSLSLLLTHLGFEEFSNSIGILGYYAESLHEEIESRILMLQSRSMNQIGFLT
jgi:hypothetical protein